MLQSSTATFDTPRQTNYLRYLPFGFSFVVPDDTNVADLAHFGLRKELIDLLLISFHVDSRDKDRTVIALSFLSLTLCLLKTALECFLTLVLVTFLILVT